MRQWILTALFLGMTLPATAQQFGPASAGELQGLDEIALVVNNEGITRRQLAAEMARERRFLPADIQMPEEALQQQLIERVVTAHLLEQLIQRFEITAGDEEVSRAIAGVAQQNGLSPAQLLQRVKRDTGLNEAAYRAQIATSIKQDKLKEGLVGRNINITPADIDAQIAQIARQSNVGIILQDLLLPTPTGNAQERGAKMKELMQTLSEALKAADGNLEQVAAAMPEAKLVNLGRVNIAQIPGRFARAVATQPIGEVIGEPVVDSDGMHFLKVLDRQSDGSVVIPEAQVEHILLRVENQDEIAAQKAVIDELYQRLQQGEDFAQLASRYSQDPGSAARGGSLGWMSADQVVPAFANAMLSVPLDTISEPFLSTYGWHIMRVSDRREVDRADDILRARIRESLFSKYLEDAWQQRLVQLRQQAYVEYR